MHVIGNRTSTGCMPSGGRDTSTGRHVALPAASANAHTRASMLPFFPPFFQCGAAQPQGGGCSCWLRVHTQDYTGQTFSHVQVWFVRVVGQVGDVAADGVGAVTYIHLTLPTNREV